MRHQLSIVLLLLFCVVRARGGTRSVHVFVALADNTHQRIVPVTPELGNGDKPDSNLYWGAMYGVKTFLRRKANWRLVSCTNRPGRAVLERCVFLNETEGILLVADAYRGREIRRTVRDFLYAAAGHPGGTVSIGTRQAGTYGSAELVVYVGHNGLMDFHVPPVPPGKTSTRPDAIVLACNSKSFFEPRLRRAGANPVLLTTGRMAPEAYTLEAALRAWAAERPANEIREQAARAYHTYQKCGITAAHRLFYAP